MRALHPLCLGVSAGGIFSELGALLSAVGCLFSTPFPPLMHHFMLFGLPLLWWVRNLDLGLYAEALFPSLVMRCSTLPSGPFGPPSAMWPSEQERVFSS